MMSARFQVPVHIVDSPLTWSNRVLPHWQSFVEATLALPHSSSSRSNLPIVGLDAEWVRKRPMAVLQVGSMHGCFLFQMQRCAGPPADSAAMIQQWLPDEVVSFLKSEDVVKCGVNISGDLRRLEREQGIFVTRHMELDHVALLLRQGDVGGGQLSLGALSERILGVPLGKDINVTLSDWEADALAPQQVQYAADDAIASALIACELYRHYTASVEAEEGLIEDIRTWVERIREPAMVAFKLAHKELSKIQNTNQPRLTPLQRAEAKLQRRGLLRIHHEDDQYRVQSLESRLSSSAADGEVASTPPVSYTSVRVLSQDGHYIFSCDTRKADWYKKRNLAVEVKSSEHETPSNSVVGSEKGQVLRRVIQLTFDPKMKTKLCMHHQLGTCQVGEYCPYAHGPDELRTTTTEQQDPSSLTSTHGDPPLTRPLRNDDKCAICLSTSTSIKHAIVPPKLRKFLPKPFHCGTSDDFVLVCVQCNPRVRIVYDDAFKRVHEEACRVGGPDAEVNIHEVKRVVGYAQMLYASKQPTSCTPATDSVEAAPIVAVAAGVDDAPPPSGPHGTNKVPLSRLSEMSEYLRAHWKCSHMHLTHPHLLPVLEEDSQGNNTIHGFSPLFLEALVKVTPGDVRARASVRSLVGTDTEKAAAFVQRWRTVFVTNFKPAYCPWLDGSHKASTTVEATEDADCNH